MTPVATPPSYLHQVRLRLHGRDLGVLALFAAFISSQMLFQANLFSMWALADIAQSWVEYYAEVLLIGAALLVSVVCLESLGPMPRRLWIPTVAAALVLPVLLLVWLFAWRYSGSPVPASPWTLLGETLKFSVLGAFAYGVRALQRHTDSANAKVLAMDLAQRELEAQASDAQLQLLQAQIEPHFLFNTLANVRRLYRKQPEIGGETIDNLLLYLRAALPQVRRVESTLGEEFDLARAYLQLFRVRMGARLHFVADLPPALRPIAFPPMVLVTLAENAIKHGVMPAGRDGTVRIAARLHSGQLEVVVCDDGVGLGASASAGGTGLGLTSIRRQLDARHGSAARLEIEETAPSGVCARVSLPLDATSSRTKAAP